MRIWILIVLISIPLVSCNTRSSEERRIKQTVTNFLNAAEKKERKKCEDLIYEGDHYSGAISMQLHYLNKNLKNINYEDLKNNIKIKDTVYILGAKMKYVKYIIKNPNNKSTPLMMTFVFYKPIGYDKIYSPNFLENFLD